MSLPSRQESVDSIARSQARPLRTLLFTASSVFGTIWLVLEPLGAFGFADQLEGLGGRGYLALVLFAVVAGLAVAGFKLGQAYRAVARSLSASAQIGTVAAAAIDTHQLITALADSSEWVDLDTSGEAVATLLADLQIVELDVGTHRARAVSDEAGALLNQLGDALERQQPFVSSWVSDVSEDKEARRDLLRMLERRRQGYSVSAVRSALSVIVLVTVEVDGKPRLLTQWSDSWGPGYYWFIGGVVERSDTSLVEAAQRELWEEVGVSPSDVHSMEEVGRVVDSRVSERIGVMTDYEYVVFHCTLKPDYGGGLPYPSGRREIQIRGKLVRRKLGWFTSEELGDDGELARHAPGLLERVRQLMIELPPGASERHLKRKK